MRKTYTIILSCVLIFSAVFPVYADEPAVVEDVTIIEEIPQTEQESTEETTVPDNPAESETTEENPPEETPVETITEYVYITENRPFFSTPLEDFSVEEGLLLLILVFTVFDSLFKSRLK